MHAKPFHIFLLYFTAFINDLRFYAKTLQESIIKLPVSLSVTLNNDNMFLYTANKVVFHFRFGIKAGKLLKTYRQAMIR